MIVFGADKNCDLTYYIEKILKFDLNYLGRVLTGRTKFEKRY